jgi:hypothetical protein
MLFQSLISTVSLDGKTLKDIILFLFDNYLDFILIGYVFICFQIAGYVELDYKQDFITVFIIKYIFTPLSIFFFLQKGTKK